MIVTPADRIAQLLTVYGSPEASAADLLCDQHPADSTAYTVVGTDLRARTVTYGELGDASRRFASALAALGVRPGDRVATLLGKSPAHLAVLLGTWRLGAVQVPLFTAFAPPAIEFRVSASYAKVVVCDPDQRHKLDDIADLPAVVVTGAGGGPSDLVLSDLLATHGPDEVPTARQGGHGPFVQMYTSGTTGRPKGVVVPVMALASFHAYMEFALALEPDDVFWNAADPAWGYGLYFGVLGSLCLGVHSVWLEGGFSAERTLAVLAQEGVTHFAAAPTAYRSLRAAGLLVPEGLELRRASAAGEPLTPEINEWTTRQLGVAVHDHYGQTETGMLINNHHHPDLRGPLKAGSMGTVMPGWSMSVLDQDEDKPAAQGTMGRIAINLPASPLAWFDGYVGEPDKTAEKFTDHGRWYLTGDTGRVDEDGYYHFMSRDDDVIIMAGYRIGPFDVESALATHPAVQEVAVVAAPDQLRGEVLEAHVVLRPDAQGDAALVAELQDLVRTRYAAHAYPRAVHFVPDLPKTPSGKIQRYVLRQRRAQAASAGGAEA